MGHVAVLVIGENVAKILAPFEEHTGENDFPKAYSAFKDEEDALRAQYETEQVHCVIMPDGTFRMPYDSLFEIPVADGKFERPQVHIPEHLEQRLVSFKEMYDTFERFALEWHGYDGPDAETGRYGQWVNPNGKWDWYVIGGVHIGRLKLKAGAMGEMGTKPPHNPNVPAGFADRCYIDDLDIPGTRATAEAAAAQCYDEFHRVLGGRPVPRWDDFQEKFGRNTPEAMLAYHSHPVIQDFRNVPGGFPVMHQTFMVDRAEYLKAASRAALALPVIVFEGKWLAQGNMPLHEWNEKLEKILDNLAPDTMISVVDAHC